MLYCFVYCLSFIIFVHGQICSTKDKLSNQLILISAPGLSNYYYKDRTFEIIKFQINFAKAIIGKNNVIVIADNETIPYLVGGHPDVIQDKLPPENVLQGNIDDIWIRDYGTIKQDKPVKAEYLPIYQNESFSIGVQWGLLDLLKQSGVQLSERNLNEKPEYNSLKPLALDYYPNISIDGGNLVYDFSGNGIVTNRVLEENKQFKNLSIIKPILQRIFGISNLVFITQLGNMDEDTTGHADLMVSFIDENTVAIGQHDKEKHIRLVSELKSGFGSNLTLVEVPSFVINEKGFLYFTSSCGGHINSLVTRDYIYMPTFGDDPENRAKGYTVENDNKVFQIIQNNTRKQVIKVPVPYKVCVLGGSVRCLSMQIEGLIADRLIALATKSE